MPNIARTIIFDYMARSNSSRNPILIHLAGIPGSGKTTYREHYLSAAAARDFGIIAIDHDDVMECIPKYCADREQDPVAAFQRWEGLARDVGRVLVETLIRGRRNILCDHGAASENRVGLLLECRRLGYHTEMHYLPVSFKEASERVRQREEETKRHTPPDFLSERAQALEIWLPEYRKTVDRFITVTPPRPSFAPYIHYHSCVWDPP